MEDGFLTEEQFQHDLNREDELGKVIRAHLHIENIVDRLLEMEFKKPDVLKQLHLDYNDRVLLLQAFGYTEMLTRPLAAFGNLRNAVAHNLSSSLTEDKMQSLYNSFDSHGKEIIQNSYRRTHQQSSDSEMPRSLNKLHAPGRFLFFAISIHAMLVVSYNAKARAKAGTIPEPS